MRTQNTHRKTNLYLLRLLVLILIATTLYALSKLHTAGGYYSDTLTRLDNVPSVVASTRVGSKPLNIPSYTMFSAGHIWALVSRDHPLEAEAGYKLIEIPVAHGDAAQTMKIASTISDDLQRLVNAAEADGEPLMISSAYRSVDEQKKLYRQFVAENGEEMAALYVLPPGTSEHHTGLSVDFSSVSDECAADSDSCSLSQSAAAWLKENASRFGFIQRYPAGAKAITGVGFEPWHYRYVGKPLAEAMATTDLTLEEVTEKLAPGYARVR